MPTDDDAGLAGEVAVGNNALAAAGQSDLVWGHASLRDPAGRGAWMKASGWGFEEVTPERVVLVARDGGVVAGTGRRHIEFPIHLEVMAARPDVGSVVHTHGAAATAFASLAVPLRALSHDGVEFALPPVPRHTRTGSLIRTAELGRALADTVGDGPGCLIPQHGLVTVGPDLATAVMRAMLLDRACAQQLRAMAAGHPVLWSDDEELRLKQAEVWPPEQIRAGYRYLVRKAAASGGASAPDA
ncbi:class II aldolase/adducin family protein [Streptomyces sp. NPDC051985]|uniref:class II aldolase/adducin family protein n=1 Tax=Streptomyces sp. NPDC051985 TaxID=3155807 RepID=UPI0034181A54